MQLTKASKYIYVALFAIFFQLILISVFNTPVKASDVTRVGPPCRLIYSIDLVNAHRDHHPSAWGSHGKAVDLMANGMRGYWGQYQTCYGYDAIASISGTATIYTDHTGSKNIDIVNTDENGNEIKVSYMHMDGYYISNGQQVREGDLVGIIGDTGIAFGAHIDFSVYRNDEWLTYDKWEFSEYYRTTFTIESDRHGYKPLEVSFNGEGHPEAARWYWEFGDGNTSTEANPTHTYSDFGVYTVSLVNENGYRANAATRSRSIIVSPWTQWRNEEGKTVEAIESIVYQNKLFQAVRGQSYPHKIWYRYSTDGVFDGGQDEEWKEVGGNTSDKVSMAIFQDELYMAVKGNSGKIFTTKYLGEDQGWQTEWNENGGGTSDAVAMANFVSDGEERLYQAVKGDSTNRIYTRYTTDGVFDNSEDFEDWFMIDGETINSPEMISFNNRLYMSIQGKSREIWTRSTADGVFDNSSTSEEFVQNGGKTKESSDMAVHGGKLYQSVMGNSTDFIFTRSSSDGSEWSGWREFGGETPSSVSIFSFQDTLYQYVRGNSNKIFQRNLIE